MPVVILSISERERERGRADTQGPLSTCVCNAHLEYLLPLFCGTSYRPDVVVVVVVVAAAANPAVVGVAASALPLVVAVVVFIISPCYKMRIFGFRVKTIDLSARRQDVFIVRLSNHWANMLTG